MKESNQHFRPAVTPHFIDEKDLGPELTEDNCTAELWAEIKPPVVRKKPGANDGAQTRLGYDSQE